MTHNRSPEFMNVLQDLAPIIASNLQPVELSHLSLTSLTMYRTFHSSLQAAKLLRLMYQAYYKGYYLHYPQIKKIVTSCPAAIFPFTSIKATDKESPTIINPLGLALYMLDEHLCQLFYRKILVSKNNYFKECFRKQVLGYNNHFNMQPLFDSYETYIKIHTRYQQQNLFTNYQELPIAWLKIGKEQCKLPLNLLYEFCRSSTFQQPVTSKHPRLEDDSITILRYRPHKHNVSYEPLHLSLPALGKEFTLMSLMDFTVKAASVHPSETESPIHDLSRFKLLYRKKIAALQEPWKRLALTPSDENKEESTNEMRYRNS